MKRRISRIQPAAPETLSNKEDLKKKNSWSILGSELDEIYWVNWGQGGAVKGRGRG